jgi:hypothetical protein
LASEIGNDKANLEIDLIPSYDERMFILKST